jgi:enoyl-CoA hydratase/3-hydroxyacyl-CoA dehydrogenase
MGHGIGELLALAGFDVTLVDVDAEFLKKAMDNIKWSLGKFVEKKRIMDSDAKEAISRIRLNVDMEEAVSEADLVIEAVPENLELKKSIFTKIDRYAPDHAILASNTSSLSITEMGDATARPDKVVGMHFFNPPVLMALVEVIKGEKTSDKVLDATVEIVKDLGKTPIVVKKDVRGFIVNRVLGVVLNEAFWAVHRGEASIEEVDAAVKYKIGFPLGAFELSDMIGLDVIDEVADILEEAYGDAAKACPMVKKMVKEGDLGQKTGKGFYDWKIGRPRIPFRQAGKFDALRLQAVTVNEAARLIYDDVAEPEDVDQAMKLGTGWPSGPCEYGDRLGIDVILCKLQEMYAKYGEEAYKPSPLIEDYVSKGWNGRSAGKGFYEYG